MMSTARWVHGHLMKMDCVSRHEQFYRLKESRPRGNFMLLLTGLFGPDQLLIATFAGNDVAPVIILPDKISQRQWQFKIDDFVAKKARRLGDDGRYARFS